MNKLPLFLDIGSLVRINTGKTSQPGRMGIVVGTKYRWSDPLEEELSVAVLYPDTGEEVEWSEYHLEVVG